MNSMNASALSISSVEDAAAEGDIVRLRQLLITTDTTPDFGISLHRACANNHTDCLQALIAAGANSEAKDDISNRTPLHWAASKGHTDCLQALITARANIEAKNQYGYTPLHDAASTGHTDCLQALVTAGANVNALNKYSRTPLHFAAAIDQTDCLKELITAGANVNALDQFGSTPLRLAAQYGHTDCLQELITAGVYCDRSIYGHALKSNNPHVIEILLCNCYRIFSLEKKLVTRSRKRLEALILSLRYAGRSNSS